VKELVHFFFHFIADATAGAGKSILMYASSISTLSVINECVRSTVIDYLNGRFRGENVKIVSVYFDYNSQDTQNASILRKACSTNYYLILTYRYLRKLRLSTMNGSNLTRQSFSKSLPRVHSSFQRYIQYLTLWMNRKKRIIRSYLICLSICKTYGTKSLFRDDQAPH